MVEKYLNLVEASRYLGISRATLYKLIREDKLPVYQSDLNRTVRLVRRADLDRLRQPRTIRRRAEGTDEPFSR